MHVKTQFKGGTFKLQNPHVYIHLFQVFDQYKHFFCDLPCHIPHCKKKKKKVAEENLQEAQIYSHYEKQDLI